MLQNSKAVNQEKIVCEEKDVPCVSQLNTIVLIFSDLFSQYIKSTKSFASILWLLGYQLLQINKILNAKDAARYFEESRNVYERLKIKDEEYFQCLSHMGTNYLEIYEQEKNTSYLRLARSVSDILFNNRINIKNKTTRDFSIKLRENIKKYIPNI